MLTHLDLKLRQIVRRVPGVVEVGYDDLATSDGAARVFEHALGLPFDAGWYEALRGVNLQEPFVTFERYAVAYLPQLTRMAGLAKGAALRDMAQGRTERSDDGVSFAEEPFETFLRDGPSLFAEHSRAVGEVPESFRGKNLPLLRALDAEGALQIVTARSNGRMFGYLMSEITPSREAPDRLAAVETTFFASGVMPGLGMKLQRETLRRLRGKGVAEVWFRAGTRGNGPKLGSMFRRVGAAEAGTLWKLDLSNEGTL